MASPKQRAYKRINDRLYHVESLSETLGYHEVIKDSLGHWRCRCFGFQYRGRCAHVEIVEADSPIPTPRKSTLESLFKNA